MVGCLADSSTGAPTRPVLGHPGQHAGLRSLARRLGALPHPWRRVNRPRSRDRPHHSRTGGADCQRSTWRARRSVRPAYAAGSSATPASCGHCYVSACRFIRDVPRGRGVRRPTRGGQPCCPRCAGRGRGRAFRTGGGLRDAARGRQPGHRCRRCSGRNRSDSRQPDRVRPTGDRQCGDLRDLGRSHSPPAALVATTGTGHPTTRSPRAGLARLALPRSQHRLGCHFAARGGTHADHPALGGVTHGGPNRPGRRDLAHEHRANGATGRAPQSCGELHNRSRQLGTPRWSGLSLSDAPLRRQRQHAPPPLRLDSSWRRP